jgi:hypothetical protein
MIFSTFCAANLANKWGALEDEAVLFLCSIFQQLCALQNPEFFSRKLNNKKGIWGFLPHQHNDQHPIQ